MIKNKSKSNLFFDFDKIDTKKWKEQVIKDLGGADISAVRQPYVYVQSGKKIVWRTDEGFDVNPFYTNEDLLKTDYTDKKYLNKTGNKSWFICEKINVCKSKDAINKAVNVLQEGANSVNFIIDDAAKFDFNTLLIKIDVTSIPVTFTIKKQPADFLKKFYFELNKLNIPVKKIKGSIDSFSGKDEDFFEELVVLHSITKSSPDFYCFNINQIYYGNKESTITKQIACLLNDVVYYLNKLTDKGISAIDIVSNIQFNLSIGLNYFFEIAKLRAVRYLWYNIIDAFEIDKQTESLLKIHAEVCHTGRDSSNPEMNMLRSATSAMAAILGGCDSITIAPFYEMFPLYPKNAERIARNIPIIFKEEAYLDKVIDPAEGSYYIENLTYSIAKRAWEIFLEMEMEIQ